MTIKTSKFAGVVLLQFLVAGSAISGNLCDEACLLSIDFLNGGSIDAVESLTVTFGDGGLVDTAGSVTAYLAGETLALNAGESLAFEDGGSFDIGDGGNIEYTNLAIGTVGIEAVGGAETIEVPAGATLSLYGGATLNADATIDVGGTINIDDGSQLVVSGDGAPLGCSLLDSSGSTLIIGGGSPGTIDNGASCNEITRDLALISAVGTLTIGGTLDLDLGDVDFETVVIDSPGEHTITGVNVDPGLEAVLETVTGESNDDEANDESPVDDIASGDGEPAQGVTGLNSGGDGIFGSAASVDLLIFAFCAWLTVRVRATIAGKSR